MRLVLIITVLLVACLAASSSPIDGSRLLVNWPSPELESKLRIKRSEQDSGALAENNNHLVKRFNGVLKGEYQCGDKICKLAPGKKTCDGCQYPMAL